MDWLLDGTRVAGSRLVVRLIADDGIDGAVLECAPHYDSETYELLSVDTYRVDDVVPDAVRVLPRALPFEVVELLESDDVLELVSEHHKERAEMAAE